MKKQQEIKTINIKKFLSLGFIVGIFCVLPSTAFAQIDNSFEGKIVEVSDQTEQKRDDGSYISQKLRIHIKNPETGELNEIELINNIAAFSGSPVYEEGDNVIVIDAGGEPGRPNFYISDYNRKTPLIGLFVIFAIVVVGVASKWGFNSLVGMAYSFLIIFKFILPQILNGANPLTIALIGCLLISPVTFILSHGYNIKTVTSIIGTFIALGITGILAILYTKIAHLTGYGSEESLFLQVRLGEKINIQGIYLAGIIIGTLGILDDVTVSQASIVKQLKVANSKLKSIELYKMAMSVGHDHISSAVNTLVLVYTGAAMPLLLLFLNTSMSYSQVINYQIVAEEIVRTLVSSIGLVLAVPITTILAVNILDAKEEYDLDNHHGHHAHHH